MRPLTPEIKNTVYTTTLLLSAAGVWLGLAGSVHASAADNIAKGKALTLEQCQACHHYEGTEQAGTVAPPLLQMKTRFPDPKKLQRILFDPTKELGPDTMMPPFGRNKLLTDAEINLIIEYLYSL